MRDGEHWRGEKGKEGERDSISLMWFGRREEKEKGEMR